MSAYRGHAEHTLPAAKIVLCEACAAELRVDLDTEVHCERCNLSAPALRDGTVLRGKPKLVRYETSGSDAFTAVAGELGQRGKFRELYVRCDGVEVRAALDFSEQQPIAVEYSLAVAGLPRVVFRTETREDRAARREQLVREVQTGDEEFDEKVYVESDHPHAELATFLEPPAIRDVIKRLVRGGATVRIDDDGVRVRDEIAPKCFGAHEILWTMGAVRIIAGAPHPAALAAPASTLALRLPLLTYALAPLGVWLIMFGLETYKQEYPGGLLITGALVGIVLGLGLQWLLTWWLRGRATAHTMLRWLRPAALFGAILFCAGLVVVLNGAFSRR